MSYMEDTMIIAMRRRLTVLVRKCGIPEDDPDMKSLMTILLKHLRKRKDYEEVFASEESTEKFANQHKLSPHHQQMLLGMQMKKDIFTPNPLLDQILTVIFLAEVAFAFWTMWDRGLAFYFLILCLIIDAIVSRVRHVSTVCGQWLSTKVFQKGFVDSAPLSGPIQMKKWNEQSWQLFIHVGFSLMEFYILLQEKWWEDPSLCYIPHPWEQRGKFRADLQGLYLAQLAVWMYTCFIHRFVDERRKDYFVMYIHHIFTIALVGISWALGYLRIGLLVLFIHDVSDIFVDLLKLVNYLKLEGPKGFFLSELAYASCVISWIYWRLYEFPFRVLKGSLIRPVQLVTRHSRSPTTFFGIELWSPDLPYSTETNLLLFALLALHVYWFHLFLMIGYRILTESARAASRQEYEGDSDDEDTSSPEDKPADNAITNS